MRILEPDDEIKVGTVLQARIDGIPHPKVGTTWRNISVPIDSILVVLKVHFVSDEWFDADCWFDGMRIEVAGEQCDYNVL
jgi:hypothetical protein